VSSTAHTLHVSLIATSDAQVTPFSGIFETLTAFELLSNFMPDLPKRPFRVEIVAPNTEPITAASGLPLGTHRSCRDIDETDIAIVPQMMVDGPDWERGRYPGLVEWLREMHGRGAMLCSACTGVLLLAETGLLDGGEATIHWAFAPTFRRNFPSVKLFTEEVLLITGRHNELVMTGGFTSWHDLVLHLIASHVNPRAAHAMARLMMLHWHGEGAAPYLTFSPRRDHGDAVVLQLQDWLDDHYTVANPVREMIERSGLSCRSFERRFAKATGLSPIAYVQALRIEEAKRWIENTDSPLEEISCEVGYENVAYFRRLFKRSTRLTPGQYRRKFRIPHTAKRMLR